MNWFQNCTNESEIKTAWRTYAKEHHPDVGGNLETMQEINSQYEAALKGDYRGRQGMDEAKTSARWSMDQEIMQKAQEILKLNRELQVEVCGVWLWITGNTKEVKEGLKALACRWSPKKLAWYYRREVDGGRRWHKRNYSLDEIRARYGSDNVDRQDERANKQFAAIA